MKPKEYKPKPVTMWAIFNIHGYELVKSACLYVGTSYTRSDMIKQHVDGRSQTWRQCKAAGDRCVKVIVKPITK